MSAADRPDDARPPTVDQQVRREQRRLAGWPALLGLVLGAALVLRLRALDDRLLTRDVQGLLLVLTLLAVAAAAVLALVCLGLRRLRSRGEQPSRWWLAPAWVSWWAGVAGLVASSVVGFWSVATTGDFFV